tara:strand:- start:664 stop:1302 length:639 start_codon:yes stop_codon:yes gene_type:complete
MANRFPLIVDSSSQQIKELPDGDSLLLGDNEKLIIGDGTDASIFSDGTNGYMRGFAALQNKVGDHDYITFADGGATSIYFDNAVKLATTATGISVTGLLSVGTSATIAQVALTSASSVTWDARAAANAYLLLGHNATFAAPSNAVEGAIISVEIAQPGSGGPYTVGWNTIYEFAASTAPTMTATASKTDIFSFRYNGSIWQEIGRVQNLAQT